MFYPNSVDEQQAKQIPYEPVKIIVSKQDYTLKLVSGSTVIASKPVGLGNQDATPEGDFTIRERVIKRRAVSRMFMVKRVWAWANTRFTVQMTHRR